jgi:hypothetical protein
MASNASLTTQETDELEFEGLLPEEDPEVRAAAGLISRHYSPARECMLSDVD